MSAGRQWWRELYVGFLLFLLSFLYLSQLIAEIRAGQPAGKLGLKVPAAFVRAAQQVVETKKFL